MSRWRHLGLYAALGFIVFSAVPGYQAPDGHNFVAYYAICILGLSLLPLPWPAKAFGYACAASCVWLQVMVGNVEPPGLSARFWQLYVSANCDFQFVMIFLGFYAVIMFIKPDMETWLTVLAWFALIECIRVSVQRLGWDPVFMPINRATSITVAAGSQGNVGWNGMVLALCAPAFFRRRLWWGLLPLAGALYLHRSVTPVAAFLGAAAVFIWFGPQFRPSWRLVASVLAVSGLALYLVYDPGDSARFVNWGRAWELCTNREAWLLGYGLGSWIFLFPVPGTSFHRAHCEPLQVWFELGMIGVVILLLYGRFLMLRFYRRGRYGNVLYASAGVAAVILCSLGNFPFHLAGTAALAVGWLAMFDRYTRG